MFIKEFYMFFKKIMIATTAFIFLISTLPVEAVTFGKSTFSNTSTSHSNSSSLSFNNSNRNSTNTNTTPSKGGISQGTSIGMMRSNVANNVKNGNYSAPANGSTVAGNNQSGTNYNNFNNYTNRNYNNNGNYYNNNGYNIGYNNGYSQQTQGHSTGTVLGAAAAGALAGYALGNHNNNNGTNVVPNGGSYNNGTAYNGGGTFYGNGNSNPVIVDNNGNYTTAPISAAPVQSSSVGFDNFIWTFLKIIIGLIILFFIVRFIMNLFNRSASGIGTGFSPIQSSAPLFNNKTPEDEIRDMKEEFFIQFQQNNRPSGLDYIRQNSTSLFYNAVEDMVRNQSDTRSVKVRQLEAELVDLTQEGSRYIASVRYHAIVVEVTNDNIQNSEVKELWNFVYENNRWKLAGIEQL
jgi:hypothetical protein